ncbi:hypothetical protein IMCC20628_00768 [Hoeflea sp. IMCC20628]|uniref:hypothetical protein n=1 Tax=Hoeflea sp. IMCC20628 TaxID=1620421 RepID=UPI00063BDA8E|nr:hypothetical protein [Hoeflea sp. IMCC20628]AKH99489.1 hypothetical protein IMCC20628_00768 [Hoeflea sp. IMCC20628]
MRFMQALRTTLYTSTCVLLATQTTMAQPPYPIPDTGQSRCYDATKAIDCPTAGEPFYGQDAQYIGAQPSYTDNGNGTVTDNVTGLIWVQTPDLNGDGLINIDDKLTYEGVLCSNARIGRI